MNKKFLIVLLLTVGLDFTMKAPHGGGGGGVHHSGGGGHGHGGGWGGGGYWGGGPYYDDPYDYDPLYPFGFDIYSGLWGRGRYWGGGWRPYPYGYPYYRRPWFGFSINDATEVATDSEDVSSNELENA